MKRIVCIILAAFLLTACGNASTESTNINNPAEQTRPAESVPAETGESTMSESVSESSDAAVSNSQEVKSAQRDVFAMDTYMTITCYGDKCEEACEAAEKEIHMLDDMLSVGNPDSEISLINEKGEGSVSEASKIMIERSLDIYNKTNGAFDITVYPLMVLWGFTSENYKVPGTDELEAVLSKVGSDKLEFNGDSINLNGAGGIDLGGIAKGYTSDRLMEIFEEYDLVSGIISLGGNVQLYKKKPDGSLWKCGIQDPNSDDKGSALLGVLEAEDCAVITSGAYERFFTDDNGITYHHIIDPHTGYPANNGLISVSIISKEGILADGLSTACYVMGLDRSVEFWKNSDEKFDMILMSEDNTVYVTEGISDRFRSEYPVQVLTK